MAAQQASEETNPWYYELAPLLRKENGIVIVRTRYPQLNVDGEGTGVLGQSYFVIACNNGDFRVARALLEMGADVTKQNWCDQTPLMLVCRFYRGQGVRKVTWLLQCVTGVRESIDEEGGCGGNTALHDVAADGKVEIVRVLLRFGANHMKRNNEGHTAAEHARAYGKEKAAVLLETFAHISEIGEWRPWSANAFPPGFRGALRCLVVISKSGTNTIE